MQMVKAAIVGASGYSGEELVALLARHPGVEIVAVTSRQAAGKTVAEVFPRMAGAAIAATEFVAPSAEKLAKWGATTVFLALPHGLAAEFAAPLRKAGVQVVDLSADFRLKSAEIFAEFYDQKHPAPELLAE